MCNFSQRPVLHHVLGAGGAGQGQLYQGGGGQGQNSRRESRARGLASHLQECSHHLRLKETMEGLQGGESRYGIPTSPCKQWGIGGGGVLSMWESPSETGEDVGKNKASRPGSTQVGGPGWRRHTLGTQVLHHG